MSCGGSAETNANAAMISDVCSRYDNVTVKDGREIFHALSDECYPQAAAEFEQMSGHAPTTRAEKSEVTQMAHQKARWGLEQRVAALSEERGALKPPTVGSQWLDSPQGQRILAKVCERYPNLTENEVRAEVVAEIDSDVERLSRGATEGFYYDEAVNGALRRASEASYEPSHFERVSRLSMKKYDDQRRAKAAAEAKARAAAARSMPSVREVLAGQPPVFVPVKSLKTGDRVYPVSATVGGYGAPKVNEDFRGPETAPHEVLSIGRGDWSEPDVVIVKLRNTATGQETRKSWHVSNFGDEWSGAPAFLSAEGPNALSRLSAAN